MKFTIFICLAAIFVVAVHSDCISEGKTYKAHESWAPKGWCGKLRCIEVPGQDQIIPERCPLELLDDPSQYVLVQPDPATNPFPKCCPYYKKKQ